MEEQEDYNNAYIHVENVPIPRFYRTHLVEVNHDMVMMCSCCGSQSSGIYFVHQLSPAKFIYDAAGMKFCGFTNHDIALRSIYHSCILCIKGEHPRT